MLAGMLWLSVVALQAQPPRYRPPPREPVPPPVTVLDRAIAAQMRFQTAWRQSWERSEQYMRPLKLDALAGTPGYRNNMAVRVRFDPRLGDLACLPTGYVTDHQVGLNPMQRAIKSAREPLAVCPNWFPPKNNFPPPHVEVDDERLGIDGGLHPWLRHVAVAQRADLLLMLDSAAEAHPESNLIAGQRVRFALDQGDFAAVASVLAQCRADGWWCAALRAYATHRAGDAPGADEGFLAAIALMPDAERCTWTDHSALLERDLRRVYERLTCTERDSVNRILWWLSDPLFAEGGNERRAEQHARRMEVLLHSALGFDERFHWRAEAGGDALAEMVLRYGWPSYVYRERRRPFRHAFEYLMGRVHTVPSPAAIADPFSAGREEWSMRAPEEDPIAELKWWPTEHYAPRTPIESFPAEQTAFLRRRDQVLLAAAVDLSRVALKRRPGDLVETLLLRSSAPEHLDVLGSTLTEGMATPVFLQPVPVEPALVSIEAVPGGPGSAAARTRFAIRPPPTLAALAPGEIAMSDLVLVHAPAGGEPIVNTVEGALPRMMGGLRLRAGTPEIGVYWEMYGVGAGDSAQLSVRVERRADAGLLGRVIGAVTSAAGTNVRVSARWRDVNLSAPADPATGTDPGIMTRAIVLDIADLSVGAYELEIEVSVPGRPAARSRRPFLIR